jgi:hypothetical protein
MNKTVQKMVIAVGIIFFCSGKLQAQDTTDTSHNIHWRASALQVVLDYGFPDSIQGEVYVVNGSYTTKELWVKQDTFDTAAAQAEIEALSRDYSRLYFYYTNISFLEMPVAIKFDLENDVLLLAWITIDIQNKSQTEVMEMYDAAKEKLIGLYGSVQWSQEDVLGKTAEWDLPDAFIRLSFHWMEGGQLDMKFLKIMMSYKGSS